MDQMTTAEAAEYLRVPVATMRWWRHEDRGPVSYRLGRRVVYARADLDRWVESQKLATSRGDIDTGRTIPRHEHQAQSV